MFRMRLWLFTGFLITVSSFAQSPADKCTGLLKLEGKQFPNATTAIETATANAPRAARGPAPALPEHCEVVGKINERIGFNSQRFAIRFHMRLPAQWNGKFFFEGGGGSNGNL